MSQLAQATSQTQQQAPSSSLIKSNLLQRTATTPVHSPILQRCSNGVECPECHQKRLEREGMLQRAAVNSAPTNGVPLIVHDVLNSPGQPLDAGTRAFMEPRFGHDFSRVRVHTDARAAESARSVNALAYTVGRDVVFGAGQYAPGMSEGRRLLAHELTHTLQQVGTEQHVKRNIVVSEPQSAPEYEADTVASQVVLGQDTHATLRGQLRNTSSVPLLQRVGLFESIARFFGGGTFSDEELQAYLQFLDQVGHIEDHYDSDNKAREVVRRWQRGNVLYILPIQRKVLLIKEMLSGFTSGDDAQGILTLLRGSTEAEFTEILNRVGIGTLYSSIQGEEQKQLDTIVATHRSSGSISRNQQLTTTKPSSDVFPAEIVLEAQQRFTSNAELGEHLRLNCIEIVRNIAPRLFAQDPQLAERIRNSLSKLKGKTLTMPDAGHVLAELGVATGPTPIRFNNGNGNQEPTAMISSAWDAIMGMVGNAGGWHVFGLAVFDGYHSVTVFVDNRADGRRVYWADQWAIDPGDDFHQEAGSVSGFRRYEKAGFDKFIEEMTRKWWNGVHSPMSTCGKHHPKNWDSHCRYTATLKIWHLRTGH